MSTDGPARRTWQAVADDLRQRLDAGEFPDGDRLPTRRELMAHYDVADRTVARALHQLRDEGYLIARSTAGWIVRGHRAVVRSTRSRLSRGERALGRGAFATDCHDAGIVPRVSTAVRIEPAGETVAAALDIEPDAEVCVRDRVMRGDDEVLQLATSYLPRDLTRDTPIEEESSGPGGIYARLEESGHPLTGYTERVTIGRASEHEARQMQISPGEPVFRRRRTAWSGERAVEINDITVAGNRYELVYELPAR